MTLSSTTVKDTYNGDGSTTDFATTFTFWNSSELKVILVSSSGSETTWTEGTEYDVTGGSGTTGTVAASTTGTDYTPDTGEQLVIKSNVLDVQETDLPAGGAFPSSQVEEELDRMTRRIQQKEEIFDRTAQLSEGSTFTGPMTLPDPDGGKLLGWGSTTNDLGNFAAADVSLTTISTFMDGLLDDPDAATARTTLGATTVGGNLFTVTDASSGRAVLGVVIGTDVQAYDADTLKADTADTLTVGYNATENDAGTKSTGTFTPDPADGNFQKAVNGGAHTLAPPGSTCTIVIQYTNNASAGAVTTSGFTLVDGDTISTTDGDDFLFFITVVNSFSHLHVKALQ